MLHETNDKINSDFGYALKKLKSFDPSRVTSATGNNSVCSDVRSERKQLKTNLFLQKNGEEYVIKNPYVQSPLRKRNKTS